MLECKDSLDYMIIIDSTSPIVQRQRWGLSILSVEFACWIVSVELSLLGFEDDLLRWIMQGRMFLPVLTIWVGPLHQ